MKVKVAPVIEEGKSGWVGCHWDVVLELCNECGE